MLTFFEPSDEFMVWLKRHVGDRVVYDIGSGEAHLLKLMLAAGVKAVGIEPHWDLKDAYDPLLPVLPMHAHRCNALRTHAGVIVIARPDHSGWVDGVVRNAHPDSEVLYISKPCNVRVDLDLDDFGVEELTTPECDVERVYRVRPRADGPPVSRRSAYAEIMGGFA